MQVWPGVNLQPGRATSYARACRKESPAGRGGFWSKTALEHVWPNVQSAQDVREHSQAFGWTQRGGGGM